jgi:anaphase-promoting complex subunit 10
LDFEQDESYTPTRIMFLAGSGMNDLQEWGEMRLESPRGWVWADFSGVGDAESDSDDDDDEADDGEPTEQQSIIDDSQPQYDMPFDSENDAPTFTPLNPDTTDMHSDTDVDVDDDDDESDDEDDDDDEEVEDSMHMDSRPHRLPHSHQRQHLHTPIHQHSTPSLPRPTPRLPFAALSPNMPNVAARPPVSPRRPRMPVLRAHLVQVKILENHQNGKDTHLRGLQVFTRNDEGARGADAVVLRRGGGGDAGGASGASGGKKSRTKRDDVFELGGGLGASAWDMEPSLR